MGKTFKIFFLICGAIALGACEKKSGYQVADYEEVRIDELAQDFKIPSKIWDLAESSGAKNFIFSDVQVFLVQKNPGIVEGEAVKLSLPRGGGTVDLSRYITGEKGSFFLGFEFPQFAGAVEKKVFFISNARKRRIGKQIFGAGCNQALDITEKFMLNMQGEGLKLNTTQERYLSVIGGSFIFFAAHEKEAYLAQVTFANPQYQPLFCQEK